MVNKITGTEMWVADNRAAEYQAAGHKLAAEYVEKPAKKPVKKPVKK